MVSSVVEINVTDPYGANSTLTVTDDQVRISCDMHVPPHLTQGQKNPLLGH